MKYICVTNSSSPWIGQLVEDKGDVLIVEDKNGIQREIPIYECEVMDDDFEP